MIRGSFSFGEVLLCELAFSTAPGSKKRPVLVVADFGDADLLVAPITSHPIRGEFDLAVQEWKKAGLKLPSTIRTNKLGTVAKSCVIRNFGKLSGTDVQPVQGALRRLFERIA